jgi:type I restriction enzyme S subunit
MTAPKLRFREFSDEWKAGKLGDFAKISAGGDIDKAKLSKVGKFPVIANALTNDGIIGFYDDFKVKTPTVTVTGRGDVGHAKARFVNYTPVVRLLTIESDFDPVFLENAINEARIFVESTGVPQLTSPQLGNIRINFPSLPEQEKIAKFLAAVDARIDAGARKLELLRDYKTAVSRKTFARSLRFPGFSDEWISRKLGEISQKMKSGGTPTSTNKSYYGGKIPFLSIADMTKQGKYLTKTAKTITESGLANSSAWLVPENSLIYSMYASVGLVAINKIPIATSQAMMDIILDENLADLEFVYYALDNFREKVSRYVMTGTQGNLNAEVVKNIEILLPTLPEQQKIASLLSALDDKISQNSRNLTALREFKKALLQRLIV